MTREKKHTDTLSSEVHIPNARHFQVYTLGGFRVEWVHPHTSQAQLLPAERMQGRGAAPAFGLLKALLSRPNRFATRDWLLEQFWPDSTTRSAGDRLDDVASALRGLLRPEGNQDKILHFVYGTDGRGNGYQLDAYPYLWCDADALTWNVQQAVRMERYGDDSLPFWQRAYELATCGVYLAEEVYSDWPKSRRAETTGHLRQAVHALSRLYLERYGKAGEEEALLVLRSYWQHYQTDEDALRQLMELLGKRERFQEALAYYKQLEEVLVEEESEPDERTKDLAEYMRTKHIQRIPRCENSINKQASPYFASHHTSVYSVMRETERDVPLDVSRREFLHQFVGANFFSLARTIDSQNPLFAPILTSEFLNQCDVSTTACWSLMQGNGITLAEDMLSTYVPSLRKLTYHSSPYQVKAATITTQALLLSAIVSKHRLRFAEREAYCHEAIQISHLSENILLQSASSMYLGYSALFCHPMRPLYAIETFLRALFLLDERSPLLKSDIYLGLADAYAHCGEKQKAFEAIGLAQEHFPDNPQLDPSYLYADCTISTLYQWQARMYLALAQSTLQREYYQQAWNALTQSIEAQTLSERCTCDIFIAQADAARGLDDIELYLGCLKKGVQKARDIGSQQRYQEGLRVYQTIPPQWREKKEIQELAILFQSER